MALSAISEKALKEYKRKLQEELKTANRNMDNIVGSISSNQSIKSDIQSTINGLTRKIADIDTDLGGLPI